MDLVPTLFVVLAVVFAVSGVAALAGAPRITRLLASLGVGDRLARVIAWLELAAVAGLLAGLAVRRLGLAASLGLTLLMAGAVGYHWRAGDRVGGVPAVLLALLAGTTAVLAATSP